MKTRAFDGDEGRNVRRVAYSARGLSAPTAVIFAAARRGNAASRDASSWPSVHK